MKLTSSHKLALATAAVYVFVGSLVAAVHFLLLAGGEGDDAMSAADRNASIVMVVAAAGGLVWFVLQQFYERYVRSALRMAEELDVVEANSSLRVAESGAAEMVVLGRGINKLAAVREALEQDVAGQVRAARASLEEERSRLAALMADLNQSVIVCNLDGQVLLYNQRARDELSGHGESGGELLGLGRSIYTVFDRSLISHALERLQQAREEKTDLAAAQFVTATRSGRLLRAHMSPVLTQGGDGDTAQVSISGFVLILDDITADNERDARRDGVIQLLTEGGRGPLGNIRAAAEMLSDFTDMPPEQHERFLRVIRDEARKLSEHLDTASSAFSDDLRERWPLEEMHGSELLLAAVRRITDQCGIAAKVDNVDDSIWLRLDGFGLLQALSYLAGRLQDEYEIREVRLALTRGDKLAQLDLIWQGGSMNNETAMSWEVDAMNTSGEATPLSVREVVDRCNGEIWFQRDRASYSAFFRISLPVTEAPKRLAIASPSSQSSRPEFYDFDIFRWSSSSHALDDRTLYELAYTVFDTETTGLEPSNGDEIIQIGATRIVNRRLLSHECIDQLVDPQRHLPEASIQIHGITPDLLVGQPTIDVALPAFHAFCADSVLVAHNAAFDMRFLQLKEERLGIRFEHPVLDTLLLSAVLHPNQESHRLEAICERLGISVIGRHTALGDAMVTGEVFLKMLPLLAAMGITTLRQAREASEKTYLARVKY